MKTHLKRGVRGISFILLPVQESSTHPGQKKFEKRHFWAKKKAARKIRTARKEKDELEQKRKINHDEQEGYVMRPHRYESFHP